MAKNQKKGMGDTYLPQIAPYSNDIETYASQFGIPAPIIANIIQAESDGNVNAYKGEPQLGTASYGLMQVLETTANSMGFVGDASQLYQPGLNIYYGTRLLKQYRDTLWGLFSSDTPDMDKWEAIASSYNQGVGYYKNALQYLNNQGQSTTWDNIAATVKAVPWNGKTPYHAYVDFYGPSIVGKTVNVPAIANGSSYATDKTITRQAIDWASEAIATVEANPIKSSLIGIVLVGALLFVGWKMMKSHTNMAMGEYRDGRSAPYEG